MGRKINIEKFIEVSIIEIGDIQEATDLTDNIMIEIQA